MSMNHSLEPARPLESETGQRMTNAEAVLLCRYAKAACPQQQFDAYTPDAWFDLLGDLRFEDCKAALTAIVKRQPFVAPAEIRDEVKRIRSKRIGDFGPIDVPSGLDAEEYRRQVFDLMRRIGDGELTRENYESPALTSGTAEQAEALGRATSKREPKPRLPRVREQLPTPDDDTTRTETEETDHA